LVAGPQARRASWRALTRPVRECSDLAVAFGRGRKGSLVTLCYLRCYHHLRDQAGKRTLVHVVLLSPSATWIRRQF
jgi:hypothetical protein